MSNKNSSQITKQLSKLASPTVFSSYLLDGKQCFSKRAAKEHDVCVSCVTTENLRSFLVLPAKSVGIADLFLSRWYPSVGLCGSGYWKYHYLWFIHHLESRVLLIVVVTTELPADCINCTFVVNKDKTNKTRKISQLLPSVTSRGCASTSVKHETPSSKC